jgi:hypothetical protein
LAEIAKALGDPIRLQLIDVPVDVGIDDGLAAGLAGGPLDLRCQF